MPNPRIPALVKHMTIAIYRDGKISGSTRKDRFSQCFEIAKSRCQQYGFTTSGGGDLSEAIGLTAKGRMREAKHLSEGRAKTVLFDTLYDDFDLDESKMETARKLREKEAAVIAARKEANEAKYSKKDRL
jgi:hypothetical protein